MLSIGLRPAIAAMAVASLLGLVPGCARLGMVGDGTSVARGLATDGSLEEGVRLPRRGEGFWIPRRWVRRGANYGTDELVRLVAHAGRAVRQRHPGSRLGVADLSWRRGGPSRWHRSHQNGLDVDLLFFARDRRGRVKRLTSMPHFRADGSARLRAKSRRRVYFDVPRNWSLVRALLENPIAEVQHILIANHLKEMLIDHAMEIGEPLGLVIHASCVLSEPVDVPPHDDHMHVRVYCPAQDRALGCDDGGDRRWSKRVYKHTAPDGRSLWPSAMDAGDLADLLALSSRSFRGAAVVGLYYHALAMGVR